VYIGGLPTVVYPRCVHRVYNLAICLPRYQGGYTGLYASLGTMVVYTLGIYASLHTPGYTTIPSTLLVTVLHSGCATLSVRQRSPGLYFSDT